MGKIFTICPIAAIQFLDTTYDNNPVNLHLCFTFRRSFRTETSYHNQFQHTFPYYGIEFISQTGESVETWLFENNEQREDVLKHLYFK